MVTWIPVFLFLVCLHMDAVDRYVVKVNSSLNQDGKRRKHYTHKAY